MSPAFLGAFTSPADLPKSFDRVFVCVGRSNVGKSSFVNALTASTISKVSSTPGRTQTINAFSIAPRTLLIDLPGYGYAKQDKALRSELESRIFTTLTETPSIQRVLLIIDAFVGITDLDREMLAFLETQQIPFAVLANKADKLSQSERARAEKELHNILAPTAILIFCSAKTSAGFAEIRHLLLAG